MLAHLRLRSQMGENILCSCWENENFQVLITTTAKFAAKQIRSWILAALNLRACSFFFVPHRHRILHFAISNQPNNRVRNHRTQLNDCCWEEWSHSKAFWDLTTNHFHYWNRFVMANPLNSLTYWNKWFVFVQYLWLNELGLYFGSRWKWIKWVEKRDFIRGRCKNKKINIRCMAKVLD